MRRIALIQGDITDASVDAIVNAANEGMLGGGGVDGAIHRAAGPALLAACREVAAVNGVRCPTGEARITAAGALDARYVIHTVGPRYGIDPAPAQLLADAYRSTYRLALENDCVSLAVPAISCGVYGYPLEEAATIAVGVSLEDEFQPLAITFYLFNAAIHRIWEAELQAAEGRA
ncbi:macro domain-containing protein [Parahaliea aestuarii]|uniref:O-acetyl-ADP-ribose deacetylase n=1 Tax=Parahaliea aestuarii TaxID=1852021 RepID=A0A5C8ZP30_9GAMM|nr:macro domain-containing protein [Parahaliea aestuarii]TXS89995.1 O-acetyl-ADP-ribose deacetylase [Parahaliea aestuarii]